MSGQKSLLAISSLLLFVLSCFKQLRSARNKVSRSSWLRQCSPAQVLKSKLFILSPSSRCSQLFSEYSLKNFQVIVVYCLIIKVLCFCSLSCDSHIRISYVFLLVNSFFEVVCLSHKRLVIIANIYLNVNNFFQIFLFFLFF